MAAQSLVRRSFSEPRLTYEVNVMGTVNLLDAARRDGNVRVVVNVTSDKCYENREWEWAYREHEPMGGHDPYSSSKGCSELVTDAFRRSFFAGGDAPRLASARAGNVIGGGDWAQDRLVPDLMRAALDGAGCGCAIPTPFGRGSTCSTRSVATSCSPRRCGPRRSMRPAGTSVPPTRMRARLAGSRGASPSCGRASCRVEDARRQPPLRTRPRI